MPQILWDETPTARTHHDCSLCGRTINPGEQYRRTRCITPDFDAPYTFKECAHCQAFISLYQGEWDLDGEYGYTEDLINDWWEPSTPEAAEHKRRWSIGWRHGRDLYPIPGKETAARISETGQWTCCGNDAYHQGFHAPKCPNTPHEDDIPQCPHCGQRYDLTGSCDGAELGCREPTKAGNQ